MGFNNNKIRENEYRNITQIYYMYVISKKYIHNFLNIFPLQIQFNRENIVLVGWYINNLSHLWLGYSSKYIVGFAKRMYIYSPS